MHHFADDDFVKLINEQFNQGQIKFHLTFIKQSLCFFTLSKKQFDSDMKIKLNGRRLYETDSVKSGNRDLESLAWKQQVYYVAIKLNKANAMLF